MCGIAAYIGKKPACPIILETLKRLEYRGYDSAGIAVFDGQELNICKEAGAIGQLESSLAENGLPGSVGIGHTRWATHGPATIMNAHPHHSNDKRLAIVHNGTVINYYLFKEKLESLGYSFYGDTDSEVLANYISYIQKQNNGDLIRSLKEVSKEIEGRSVVVVHDAADPQQLAICNFGGEICIGRNENGEFLACSDQNALAGNAIEACRLGHGQIALIGLNSCFLTNIAGEELVPDWKKIETRADDLDKGTYPHFMLKEIFEQDKTLLKTIDKFLLDDGLLLENSLLPLRTDLVKANKIVIIACGTSWHAGLVSRHFFKSLAGLPVYCEYASEFLPETVGQEDIVISISQSGSTADTIQAVEAAKRSGAKIISICNVPGAPLTSLADVSLTTEAGIEIGVASTKAFTTQLAVLFLLALQCGEWRSFTGKENKSHLLEQLKSLPQKIKEALRSSHRLESIAEKYQDAKNFLYLGRGPEFPIALEGSLKLKEVSYIHAEGLSAGEMKHGSIALIDKDMPSLFIAVKDELYDKVFNNILEIRARQGRIISITTGRDSLIESKSDDTISLPECEPILYPFLTVIPLQLFAYHFAKLRGVNIDKPRNLAKSVTVE